MRLEEYVAAIRTALAPAVVHTLTAAGPPSALSLRGVFLLMDGLAAAATPLARAAVGVIATAAATAAARPDIAVEPAVGLMVSYLFTLAPSLLPGAGVASVGLAAARTAAARGDQTAAARCFSALTAAAEASREAASVVAAAVVTDAAVARGIKSAAPFSRQLIAAAFFCDEPPHPGDGGAGRGAGGAADTAAAGDDAGDGDAEPADATGGAGGDDGGVPLTLRQLARAARTAERRRDETPRALVARATHLHLERVGISSLAGLGAARRAAYVYAYENPALASLSALRACHPPPPIVHLQVDRCGLTSLEGVAALRGTLRKLYAAGNRIASLAAAAGLDHLVELHVGGQECAVDTAAVFETLPALSVLTLAHSPLADAAAALEDLSALPPAISTLELAGCGLLATPALAAATLVTLRNLPGVRTLTLGCDAAPAGAARPFSHFRDAVVAAARGVETVDGAAITPSLRAFVMSRAR